MQTVEDSKMPVCHWDRERFDSALQHARTNIHPAHWPDDVRTISLEGLALLGLDSKGHLYLDGHRVYTVKRWSAQERAIAWVVALASVLTAIAAGLSAWVDVVPLLG